MGDVIHTLPAAVELKRCFPLARLAWAVESRWAPLLRDNPFVDEVFEIPLSRWRKAKLSRATRREFADFRLNLKQAKFDLAVDFQGLLKSAAVTFFSRAERVYGFDRSSLREPFSAAFYSNHTKTDAEHVVDRYRELAASVRGLRPKGPVEFSLPAGSPKAGLPPRYVIASPLAGWGAKQWPPEHFSKLANLIWNRHGLPMLVDCAPSDEHTASLIVAGADKGAAVLHASDIPELIAAARGAAAVVGVDSGPLHLAAALERPGVAIFGPTDPARNGPYGGSIEVLRADGAETTYRRDKAVAAAMRAITPETVCDKIRPLLESHE